MAKSKSKVKPLPKPRVRRHPLTDCVQFLTKNTDKQTMPQSKPILPPRKVLRPISPSQRMLCVQLIQKNLTCRQVQDITGINTNSVRSLYHRYLERGTVLNAKRPGRSPWPLPPDVEAYLRTELHAHRFLSLRDRLAEVQQKFGFTMSYTRLRCHFKRIGVKFQRTKVVMRASTKNLKSRAKERKLFS